MVGLQQRRRCRLFVRHFGVTKRETVMGRKRWRTRQHNNFQCAVGLIIKMFQLKKRLLTCSLFLRPREGCKVLWWACLSVCLSVCPLVYLEKRMAEIHHFCACWLWLDGSILLCRRFNTLCTSGFVDDVMFSPNNTSERITQQPKLLHLFLPKFFLAIKSSKYIYI